MLAKSQSLQSNYPNDIRYELENKRPVGRFFLGLREDEQRSTTVFNEVRYLLMDL